MRIAGIVLLADRDSAGLMTPVALLVAGLGACIGGIGGAAVYVGGRKRG